MAKMKVQFGRFSDYELVGQFEWASVPVLVDGVQVGELTRHRDDEFVTASSFERKWIVSEYSLWLNVGDEGDQQEFSVLREGRLREFEYRTGAQALSAAKQYAREMLARLPVAPAPKPLTPRPGVTPHA